MKTNEEFPVLDALVVVHYDSIAENDFYRMKIERRIETYRAEERPVRPVYTLSTLQHPRQPAPEGVEVIPSKSGDEQRDYDLVDQLEALVKMLEARFRELGIQPPSLEVVGFTWWICVEATRQVLSELGYAVQVNYDCTDLVGDYLITQAMGVTFRMGDKPMPTPSDASIMEYKEAHPE